MTTTTMKTRRVSADTIEVWAKYESDRSRVQKIDGRWLFIGGYRGGRYYPHHEPLPVTPKTRIACEQTP